MRQVKKREVGWLLINNVCLELTCGVFCSAGSDMAIFCLLCGKRFQTQTALQQHMEVHAGVRSYICSECNRTFPSHTALKRHLRSHTGQWKPPVVISFHRGVPWGVICLFISSLFSWSGICECCNKLSAVVHNTFSVWSWATLMYPHQVGKVIPLLFFSVS